MAKRIYLVEGSSGEWGDFRSWPVRAFTRKDAATEYAEKARAEALRVCEAYYERERRYYNDESGKVAEPKEPRNKYDSRMVHDDTGVAYTVIPVTFINEGGA